VKVARRFPEAAGRLDLGRVQASRTFWEFDDAATGPLHGFAGADDYYARSSSLGFLDRVTTPTLCLSSQDDPFLPPSVLRVARQKASSAIDWQVTSRGGHIGWTAGSPGRPVYWAEELAVRWLEGRLGNPGEPF
jgi:predicted alpha/beta-fold hydrolase